MDIGNFKTPSILKHSIMDYVRVAIIALVVLFTIFIVKMFESRDESANQNIQEYNGVLSRIDFL